MYVGRKSEIFHTRGQERERGKNERGAGTTFNLLTPLPRETECVPRDTGESSSRRAHICATILFFSHFSCSLFAGARDLLFFALASVFFFCPPRCRCALLSGGSSGGGGKRIDLRRLLTWELARACFAGCLLVGLPAE